MNFEHLQQPTSSYKPQYIGSLLFNGKLCHANANYGCFMTVNMTEMTVAKIPENLKVSLDFVSLILEIANLSGDVLLVLSFLRSF